MPDPVNAPIAIPLATNQQLLGVTTMPEPDAVVFSFKSALPAVPMITVWTSPNNLNSDMVPQNQVAVSFGPSATDHHVRVEGLPQTKHLIYKVSVGDPARNVRPVESIGFVNTLNRVCLIEIISIEFLSVGNPDSDPVDLNFAVYDAHGSGGDKLFLNGSVFGENATFHTDDASNGDIVNRPFGALIRIENAPVRVAPWLIMANSDGFDVVGILEPDTLPSGPTSGSHGDAHFASTLAFLDQTSTVGASELKTFILASGLKGVSFEATARYQTVVTDPLGPIVKPVRRPPRGIGF